VVDFAYHDLASLKLLVEENPERFTTWFRIAFPQIEAGGKITTPR
jgi:hypothetical protein